MAYGEQFVYRARFCDERVTIAVRPTDDHFCLSEVAGKNNRPPMLETERKIRAWIASYRPWERPPRPHLTLDCSGQDLPNGS